VQKANLFAFAELQGRNFDKSCKRNALCESAAFVASIRHIASFGQATHLGNSDGFYSQDSNKAIIINLTIY